MENTHTAIIKFRDGDSAEVKDCAMMGVDASGNVLVMEMGTGGSGNGAQQGGYTLLGKQVHEDKGGADTAIKQTKKSPQTHKASAGKSASGKVQFFFEGFLQNGGEVYICLFGFFVQP